MPPASVRIAISAVLVVHLAIVSLAMLASRGAAYLHDDLLTKVATYTAAGNWRVDTNRISIANSNQLEEIIRVEWHEQGKSAEIWEPLLPLSVFNQPQSHSVLSREQRFERQWLHQLSGLLAYENDEGAGRMLMSALKKNIRQRSSLMDRVRVTVAPRLSLQQYSELDDKESVEKHPDAYRPQVAYLATIIDLGEGQLSLLRQAEARRASKVVGPLNRSSQVEGSKP